MPLQAPKLVGILQIVGESKGTEHFLRCCLWPWSLCFKNLITRMCSTQVIFWKYYSPLEGLGGMIDSRAMAEKIQMSLEHLVSKYEVVFKELW